MQNKFFAILFFTTLTLSGVCAAPRDQRQMKAIAERALQKATMSYPAPAMAPKDELKTLRQLRHCSIIGYEGGAFAIVSNDDTGPALLGVCTSGISGHDNPNFEWWLNAVNESLALGSPAKTTTPDPNKYPQPVGPLMKTAWGQETPFNNLCPVDSFGVRCFTGCVATSMAQVLAYHRMPVRAQGESTTYFPYRDTTGQAIHVHFGSEWFDWHHMRDSYKSEEYTPEEARAVAQLMVDCGVAADMEYGTARVRGGSGAVASTACEGLIRFFGFTDARYIKRDDYTEPEWMDIVYRQLCQYGPVIYGGRDGNFGHSFVIHGYREDGFVFVNWGWEGDADGYYDISLLNPTVQKFSDGQGMIIGIKGNRQPKVEYQQAHIDITTPGTLAALLPQDAFATLNQLTVSGQLSESDLIILKQLTTEGQIEQLDLSQTTFPDNLLPAQQFYGSPWLTDIKLPQGITTFGDAALGNCPGLKSVSIPEAENRLFVVDGNLICNTDTTQLISLLSPAVGRIDLPATITDIHPYALSGCIGVDTLSLPPNLKTIGAEALLGCGGLAHIRCAAKTPPSLGGYNTFKGIFVDICTLSVPSGTKGQYMRKAQWKDFTNITEFGTTIRAKNAIRGYGQPNPQFAYEVSGDAVTGTPELYTDATLTSAPGVYTIYVGPGTITAPDVEYINGKLIIKESSDIYTPIDDLSSIAAYDLQGRKVAPAVSEKTRLLIMKHANRKARKTIIR